MFVTVRINKKSVDFKYYADSNIQEENILDVFHTLYSWYFSFVFTTKCCIMVSNGYMMWYADKKLAEAKKWRL